jgi:hypothetical protein
MSCMTRAQMRRGNAESRVSVDASEAQQSSNFIAETFLDCFEWLFDRQIRKRAPRGAYGRRRMRSLKRFSSGLNQGIPKRLAMMESFVH